MMGAQRLAPLRCVLATICLTWLVQHEAGSAPDLALPPPSAAVSASSSSGSSAAVASTAASTRGSTSPSASPRAPSSAATSAAPPATALDADCVPTVDLPCPMEDLRHLSMGRDGQHPAFGMLAGHVRGLGAEYPYKKPPNLVDRSDGRVGLTHLRAAQEVSRGSAAQVPVPFMRSASDVIQDVRLRLRDEKKLDEERRKKMEAYMRRLRDEEVRKRKEEQLRKRLFETREKRLREQQAKARYEARAKKQEEEYRKFVMRSVWKGEGRAQCEEGAGAGREASEGVASIHALPWDPLLIRKGQMHDSHPPPSPPISR